jgi:hypothetical protein
MRFDTKLAIVIRDDLAPWQGLNVTGFLAGGLAGRDPEIVGMPYEDADGTVYSPLIREPIFVLTGTLDTLRRTRDRAASRALRPAIYTTDMFATDHEDANRAAVAPIRAADLDLVGVAVHGPRKEVDKVIKGLKRHP